MAIQYIVQERTNEDKAKSDTRSELVLTVDFKVSVPLVQASLLSDRALRLATSPVQVHRQLRTKLEVDAFLDRPISSFPSHQNRRLIYKL